MNQVSFVSRAAAAAGVPSRFRYFAGRSLRRYLFTAADGDGIVDFGEAVVIAVASDRIVWAGEAEAITSMRASGMLGKASFHVHLLAATAEERRAVLDDLRPQQRVELRLAA